MKKKFVYETIVLIVAFGFMFLYVAYQEMLLVLFAGLFAGFFLSLLAYKGMKQYIIDEVIRLVEAEEREELIEFIKGLA